MKAQRILALTVIITSIFVLLDWVVNIDTLKILGIPTLAMKTTTACCFLLSGVSLWFLSKKQGSKINSKTKSIVLFSSVFVILLVLSIFAGVLSGKLTPLAKEFLFENISNISSADRSSFCTVPSIVTLISFILVQISFLALMFRPKKSKNIKGVSFLVIILGFIAVIGNLFSIEQLYYVFPFWQTGMAIHTGLLFIFLGTGIYFFHE